MSSALVILVLLILSEAGAWTSPAHTRKLPTKHHHHPRICLLTSCSRSFQMNSPLIRNVLYMSAYGNSSDDGSSSSSSSSEEEEEEEEEEAEEEEEEESTEPTFDWNDDEEHDEQDEDDTIEPYLNRSLAWTLRYRKLNPYEKVRRRVLNFGNRSKEDWDECVANGWQGQYVPARPDLMYAPEWEGWEEFLGLMRSYTECRQIAVYTFGLTSLDSYILFIRSNSKRAELLRIPLRPDIFYKKEWIDEETFFRKD